MTAILENAAKALKLHRKGKSNPEVKKALGLEYSTDAIRMIEVGRRQERINDCRLTERELTVIMSLAEVERKRLARGDVSAFNGKWLGGFGWKAGEALRLMRKRLGLARKGEERQLERGHLHNCTGLGLILHWHGGGCHLTRAGWALVHALEAAGVE